MPRSEAAGKRYVPVASHIFCDTTSYGSPSPFPSPSPSPRFKELSATVESRCKTVHPSPSPSPSPSLSSFLCPSLPLPNTLTGKGSSRPAASHRGENTRKRSNGFDLGVTARIWP